MKMDFTETSGEGVDGGVVVNAYVEAKMKKKFSRICLTLMAANMGLFDKESE